MSMSSNQSGENFHGEGDVHVEELKKLTCVYGNENSAIEALRHGFLRQLDKLILNWKGRLPNLRNIFRKDEINCFLVDSLSCCGVDNNYQGERFIDFVARSCYKYEPDVDKDGKPLLRLDTAVHCAARLNCSKDLVGKLFQIYNYGIDFDYIDKSGLTHFDVACKYGFENIVEILQDPNNLVKQRKVADFLLRCNSSNLVGANGSTPLHNICQRQDDDVDLMQAFLASTDETNLSVHVNAQNSQGNTPLHLALYRGNKKLAELLLKRGADPNLTNEEGLTPLHIISQKYDDDGEFLEAFFAINDEIGRAVQVDIQNSEGDTPLHLAVTSGNKKAAELLLRRGANPNSANKEESTPLHVACRKKDDEEDLVKMLFELSHEKHHPLRVNAKNAMFFTPLIYALSNGHKKVAELLVTRCDSLSVIDAEGSTPLHDICQMNLGSDQDDLVTWLFEIIIKQDQTIQIDTQDRLGNTLLHLAFDSYRENLAKLLLRRGANPNLTNEDGETPLHSICSRDDDDIFDAAKMLFDISDEKQKTIFIDAQVKRGWTPLHNAVDREDVRLIKLLLERGANPNITNAKGETPLYRVCNRDCDPVDDFAYDDLFDLAALLLRHGANPNIANASGETPLHSICNKSYDDDAFDTLKRLFDISDEEQKPILVDAQDKWGWTPLHIAVHRKQARLIRLLLNRGANPNTANAKGETPLHKICELCEIETIAVVNMCMIPFREVKERVQADVRDNKGNAPLHIALDEGYKNLIEWLLRIGADPNCANKNGETALHIIIDRHTGSLYDKELVEEFFKIVDDERLTLQIDVKNNSGRTPLQCAAANLLPEVVGVLLDRGADLANFVFPTLCGEFGKDPEWKLTAPCRAVGVVEQLKGRGYELNRSHAMMIMKFLCRLRSFVQSVAGQKRWYDDSKAKDIMVKSDLSLHDLVHLRPEEVAKLLNYKDCLDLVTSKEFRKLPHRSRKAYTVYLGEITARRFFLRWALDPFMELIHYRLPHLCCDMIIENLENKDLYNICLARS